MTKLPTIGTLTPSLDDKTKNFVVLHMRAYNVGLIRMQGKGWELDLGASEKLTAHLKTVKHDRKSIAGTNTMYAPVLGGIEDLASHKVRVQIPGPGANREYGACVLLQHPELAKYVAASQNQGEPKEEEPEEQEPEDWVDTSEED